MENKQNIIRQQNLTRLKQFLFKQGSALKADMAIETGISVVTINALIKELLKQDFVIEGQAVQQSLGRPALSYNFNYHKTNYLLLSIQADITTNPQQLILLAKIVNLAGEESYTETFAFSDPSLPTFSAICKKLLNKGYPITKIALAFPGKIAANIVQSSFQDLFNGWNFHAELKKYSNLPLVIQNDAHLLTMGSIIRHQIGPDLPIVGIFYPEKNMPGITICANGTIFEGAQGLAGEAKYLPHLINTQVPNNSSQLKDNLMAIIGIYNAVIAPSLFLISSDSISQEELITAVSASAILKEQPNKPDFIMMENFQETLSLGLRWLVSLDTLYPLN